jgi:hypothetical protein
MTKVKLKALEKVTIGAVQGQSSRGPMTVSAWKASDAKSDVGDMTINVHRSPGLRFAPEGIHFEATITGPTGLQAVVNGQNRDGSANPNARYTHFDAQFHELEFVWETSQTGTFDLIGRHPDYLQNMNIGHGKHFSHVFEDANEHWVRCTAYRTDFEGGSQTTTIVARRTEDISVNSLESQIPAANRIYVSNIQNDPDFATIPAGAQTGYPTNGGGSLYSPVKNLAQNNGNKAIFLKRGQEFNIGGRGFSSNGNCYWGDWGSGNRPVLSNVNGPDQTQNIGLIQTGVNPAEDELDTLTVHNIDLRGQWDDITETRAGETPIRTEWGVNLFIPCWATVVGCRAEGFDNNFVFRGDCPLSEATKASFILWNTESVGWRDYGIFVSGDAWGLMIGIVGCKYGSSETANSNMGLQGKVDDRNGHSPVRTSSHYRLYVTQNDVTARFGWSFPAVQPAFRLTTESWGYHPDAEPPRIVFWGNVIENAGNAASISIAGLGHPSLGAVRSPYPLNALVKHNFILGGWGMVGPFNCAYGGTTVMENVFVRPNIPVVQPDHATATVAVRTGAGQMCGFNPNTDRPDSDTSENREHPIRYVGNTVIDHLAYTDQNSEVVFSEPNNALGNGFTGSIEYRDNVHFHDAGPFADATTGPMETAFAIAPRMTRGPTFDWNSDRNYVTYDTFGGVSLIASLGDLDILRPAAGSPVIGAATGGMGRTDILGNVRAAGAAAGAINPSS